MSLLIFYLLLAIGVSFFCSIAEAVLLSIRPSYVAALEKQGDRSAKNLKKLQDNIDRPLAAILTANTIAHTIGAAGVGAQAAFVFGQSSLGIVSAVLTFLILVFSEIIPKTLGATYWQKLAPTMSILILGLTRLLSPLVWLSEKLTRLLSRSDISAFTFSRAEMQAMAEIGAEEGLLDSKERKIVSNLMHLHHISVRSIMTPRVVIFAAAENMTVQKFFARHAAKPFSRILIYQKKRDDMDAYVLRTDLLIAQARDEFDRPLSHFRREILTVPDTMTVSEVFDRLIHTKNHIALATDKYGIPQGVVTLEDVVETLIGLEIIDEQDTVEDMQVLARTLWEDRQKHIRKPKKKSD